MANILPLCYKNCFLENLVTFQEIIKKSFRKCNCKAITNWSKIQSQFIESFNTQYMRNSTIVDLVKMESKITIFWPKNDGEKCSINYFFEIPPCRK